MTYFDDPQDVIRVLQSTPTNAELEGQAAAVDMMASAQVRPAAATAPRGRRPYRLGALIAAGVIGFGSVAAAGAGGFVPFQLGRTSNDVEDDTVIVENEPDTNEEVEHEQVDDEQPSNENEDEGDADGDDPEPAAVADDAIVPDEPVMEDKTQTPFDETDCLAGPHGRTVSAVARGLLEDLDEGIGVVEAAQSDCGKQVAGDEGVQSDLDDDQDEQLAEIPKVSEDAETTTVGPPAEHPGKGKGKGKGVGGSQADSDSDSGNVNGNGRGNGTAKGGRGG